MKTKKLLAIFLSMAIAATAAIGIAACGGGKGGDDTTGGGNNTTTGGGNNNGNNNGNGNGNNGSSTGTIDHTPVSDVAWFVVGTGSGSLKGVGWDDFEKGMMLTDDGNGYVSITLDLYNADYFKIVYNYEGASTLSWPGDEIWSTYSIGYIGSDNTAGNEMVGFKNDLTGNAVVLTGYSGTYTIKVKSDATTAPEAVDVAGGVVLERTSTLQDRDLSAQFYLVGTIASKGMSGAWPDLSDQSKWLPLTNNGDGTYSVTATFAANDEFKVYNASTQQYYTEGSNLNGGNIKVTAGEHTVTVTAIGSGDDLLVEVAIS